MGGSIPPTEQCLTIKITKLKRNYRTDYPRWYGIYGVEFIWKGGWSDPRISVLEIVMNSHDVEDAMWEEYNEYLRRKTGLKIKKTKTSFFQNI